jgi:hypothetical protein
MTHQRKKFIVRAAIALLVLELVLMLAAILNVLVVPAPASAETRHPNGSITITKEEVENLGQHLSRMEMTIKAQADLIRQQKGELASFKGKCA